VHACSIKVLPMSPFCEFMTENLSKPRSAELSRVHSVLRSKIQFFKTFLFIYFFVEMIFTLIWVFLKEFYPPPPLQKSASHNLNNPIEALRIKLQFATGKSRECRKVALLLRNQIQQQQQQQQQILRFLCYVQFRHYRKVKHEREVGLGGPPLGVLPWFLPLVSQPTRSLPLFSPRPSPFHFHFSVHYDDQDSRNLLIEQAILARPTYR
jgi:hypothetical protein